MLNEKLIHIQSVLNRLKFYNFKPEFRRKLFVIRKFPRSLNVGYSWIERKRLDGFTTPSKVSRAPPVEFRRCSAPPSATARTFHRLFIINERALFISFCLFIWRFEIVDSWTEINTLALAGRPSVKLNLRVRLAIHSNELFIYVVSFVENWTLFSLQ